MVCCSHLCYYWGLKLVPAKLGSGTQSIKLTHLVQIFLCLEREIIVIPTWSKGTSLEQEMTNVANLAIKVTYESDLTGSSLKPLPGLT